MRLRSGTSAFLAVCALVATACGSPPKDPAEPSPTGLTEDPPPDIADEPGKSTQLSNDGPKQVSGPDASGKEPDPEARTREITPAECRSLASKYGALTRSDETAKLNPKLSPAQRAQVDQSIASAAQQLETRWAESCESSLVGKVADEQSLQCAMSAKNVAAFDTCLNGPK